MPAANPTTLVGGERIAVNDITQDLLEAMTDAELTEYGALTGVPTGLV